MLNPGSRRISISFIALSLLVAIALPTTAFGQGRWHRQDGRLEGRDLSRYDRRNNGDEGYYRHLKKKSNKFINGHDARDGRWDGRGPRRNYYNHDNDYYTRRSYDYRVTHYRYQRRYKGYYQDDRNNLNSGGILGAMLYNVFRNH